MSIIKVSNLGLVGSELLVDSESYLEELNDTETKYTLGGVVVSQVTVTAGFLALPENNENYRAPAYFNLDSFLDYTSYSIKTYILDVLST